MADYPPVGSFVVIRTGGLWAWLIRLGTFSRYNHAAIAGRDGLLVEADPSGARYNHIENYPKSRYNAHTAIPEATREQIWQNAVGLLGRKYGWLDIFALSLSFFGLRFGWIADRIKRQDRLICSQLVVLAYAQAGVYLFDDGRLAQDVTPGDLADLLID
ncbi:hypothetical protein PV336_16465 [Streptomyces sp. MI02-2A]|uniref:hypothetical protein n=1 Tax=Streptomyces sp. MI02-2A TaxID=3028688 RepID=UPI0029B66376|nr:hypothetical protein [Streptomyces sp. MI02-2A]MDX3260812.1 hypothetical protein [Streptomyces sp. MI02-2A]